MHLVVGASGKAGSAVVTKLLGRGERVRAVSRDPARLASAVERGAEPVQGDLVVDGWMEAALAGVEVLVLASQGLYPVSLRNHPERSDRRGIPRLLDAARRAGVRHVVLISTDGAGPHASTLWARLKSQLETRLRASGLPHTIVRPTTFMENHGLVMLGEPLRAGRKVQIIGTGGVPLNWISADDVAEYIVMSTLESGPRDDTVRLEGPDVLTRLEALEIFERRLGREAQRSHLPIGALRAMRAVAGPFHPGVRYLFDLVLAEETGAGAPAPPATDTPVWRGATTLESLVARWSADAASPAIA